MNKIKEVLHLGGDKEAKHHDSTHHGSTSDHGAGQSTDKYSAKTGDKLDWKNEPKHEGNVTGRLTDDMAHSGTTGAGVGSTAGGAFDARDPVDSGRTVEGTQYNDRTGHTHPTTGSHHSAFERDPTSASTGGLGRETVPVVETAPVVETVPVVPVVAEHGHHHSHGHHQHTTFTANLLDPATYKEEHNHTFHEEHIHGGGIEHGRPDVSTEQYTKEHYDPSKGPDFLGRNAALGGAGVGAAGLAASEFPHRHREPATTGVAPLSASGTGMTSPSSGYIDPTGPASNTVGPHKSNILNVLDPSVGPDFVAQSSKVDPKHQPASAYETEQSGPAQRYNAQTFGDPALTGQTGQSVPGPTGSGHNILGSQHNQADYTGHGYQETPDFIGRDASHHSRPAHHHDDKMKHKNILTPSTAVSHEGEHHNPGGYADTSRLTDRHTHGTPVAGSEYSALPAGGNYPGTTTTTGATGTSLFGRNLPTSDPHHYYDVAQPPPSTLPLSSSNTNSSFRRSGYAKHDPAGSAAFDPAAANYGSSAAIGSTDGYESRAAAAQGLTHSSDMTTGLEGTQAHGKGGKLSGMLHREHPTKLHKEP